MMIVQICTHQYTLNPIQVCRRLILLFLLFPVLRFMHFLQSHSFYTCSIPMQCKTSGSFPSAVSTIESALPILLSPSKLTACNSNRVGLFGNALSAAGAYSDPLSELYPVFDN